MTLGETAAVNVTVRNLNELRESFTLAISANTHQIASIENTILEKYASQTYTIGWNNAVTGTVVTLMSPGHGICIEGTVMSRTLNGPGFSWGIEIDVRNFG